MPLLLQRVCLRIGPTVYFHVRGVDLGCLSLAARLLHLAAHRDAAAGGELLHFAFVIRQLGIGDDLDVRQARAVIELGKLNPPFESRRVRIQPRSVTSRPTASTWRASLTDIVSMT